MKAFLQVVLALGALFCFLSPWPAQAATTCMGFADLAAALKEQFQEVPVAAGIAAADGTMVIVVFSDPAGDTWTLVGRETSGQACLLASGTGWATLGPRAPGVEG